MNKIKESIAALVVLLVFLIAGVVILWGKSQSTSGAVIASLGRENAKMTERWISSIAQSKLDAALPGLKRDTNMSGGEYESGSTKFEILTAKDIYWWESVDRAVVNRVATEVKSLPELQAWIAAGTEVNQQRKVDLRVVGTTDRPILRILFLCSNLPAGQTANDGFLKNMWP